MTLRNPVLALALALAFTGCVDEDPTEVGGVLLPSGEVLTFEVLLPASEFLVNDTSFSGYVAPSRSSFGLVARSFEDVLDANTLLRYSLPPATIVVRSGATTVTDSFPRFVGGRIVFRLDTIGSTSRPIQLALFRTVEDWHASATWTQRVDTGSVQLAWSTPGGTRGAQIDTATWAAGDSVVFDVDSATLAIWNDSTNDAAGAILVSETDDSRLRVIGSTVHVNARSSVNADTVVVIDLVPTTRTFIFNPTLPTTFSGLRVGGIPAWRSMLRLRSDLRSFVFPCVGGPEGCQVSLDSVHINTAQLLLRPLRTSAGFIPEDSLFIEARTVLLSPLVPLERSPVGNRVAISSLLAAELFTSPSATDVVKLDITTLINHLLDESVPEEDRLPPLLSILQLAEAQTFGFATFEAQPMLRLVITTALERTQ
jgi:hypothetical protein